MLVVFLAFKLLLLSLWYVPVPVLACVYVCAMKFSARSFFNPPLLCCRLNDGRCK
jgi:hypothetical protein